VIVAAHLWQALTVPGGFTEIWHQELHSLAELAHLRSRLRGRAHRERHGRVPGPGSLVRAHGAGRGRARSNALRHGAPPAAAMLSRSGEEWMIAVTDSAGGIPPRPAEGRDPGRSGFGLYLVADLSQRHGWCTVGDRKVLWALLVADAPAS
jgi:hypothetical protein